MNETDYTKSVRAALRAQLLTVPGMVAEGRIEKEARKFDSPIDDANPWARESLKPYANKRRGISRRFYVRHFGLYLVDTFTASGEGTGGGDTLADAIVEHFYPGLQLIRDGITITVTESNRMGSQQETDWLMVPVSISYYFDIQRNNPE